LGGRDYGIFETVHLGLGLPLVYPLMAVENLNTDGVRVVKDAEHLAKLKPGEPVVWESRIEKFNRRLEFLRRHAKASETLEEEARREAGLRDVSLYEFYSVNAVKGNRISLRTAPVALQVTPGFGADCACVGHGLHEAYARRCVVAFWRLMPTVERWEMMRGVGPYVSPLYMGGTRLDAPMSHGGAPLLDRFLGIGDLCAAFEGPMRQEMWFKSDAVDKQHEFVQRRRARKDKAKATPVYGWGFALVEMLVDPVLRAWVPQWVVEQFERRNPGFWDVVAEVAKDPKVRTNTKLIVEVRKKLQ
jgi:hypothetical protein